MAEMECLFLNIPMVLPKRGGITEWMIPGKQGFFFENDSLESAAEYCSKIISGEFQYDIPDPKMWEEFSVTKLSEQYKDLYFNLKNSSLS